MQIYVCVKHVPDSAANITILENNRIDEHVGFLLNPYDEHAVTEAVRIKKSLPDAEVIAVCLGKEDAENTVRSALAMGADRGVLVVSDSAHDSIQTAGILKKAIELDGNPGLIFTGKESIDAEGMQTHFRIAALFDFPVATNVSKLRIEADKAAVDCEVSGGITMGCEMSLPCVIGAGRGLNIPGYPTFRDVVMSKKKPVQKVMLADLAVTPASAGMRIVELEPLKRTRQPREIKGDAKIAAAKIASILKEEAKVI